MCLCVYISKRIHVPVGSPIGTTFGTHMPMRIHLGMNIG